MDIVEELRQDREKGAKRLESEYKAGLMTLAMRFCTDQSDAEELVNRTFAEVVDGIDDYLEQSAFFGWMCQILKNLHSLDVRRKSNQCEVFSGDVPDTVDGDAQYAIYSSLDRSIVRVAIETLEPDEREALLLHYFMDIPVKRMAKILATSEGTVKRRLHYARKALAVKLGVAVKKCGIKKPAVAIIAIALMLLGLTAAVIVGNVRSGTEDRELEDGIETTALTEVLSAPQADTKLESSQKYENNQKSENNQKGETLMSKAKAAAAALTAAFAVAPLAAANGDEYQFIDPDTYPAENASYPSRSLAVALDTGALCAFGEEIELEARSRTKACSQPISLTTTDYFGMIIIVR